MVYPPGFINFDSVFARHNLDYHGSDLSATGQTLRIYVVDIVHSLYDINTIPMKSSVLHKVGLYLILASVLAIPLFFLPIVSDFYEYNKHFLLLIMSSLLLLTWVATFLVDKQVRITRSPLNLPFLFIILSWIISTYLRTPNRIDALLEPGQTATVIALAVFFFSAVNFIKTKKDLDLLTHTYILSITLLSLISIFWSSGLASQIIPSGAFKTTLWTPTGNLLTTLILTILSLPFIGILIARQKGQSNKTLALVIALFLVFLSSCLTSYRIFRDPNSNPVFLSQSTSWAIALESLKASPLLGSGPATYLSDFSRFKPLSHNLTSNWMVRFNSSTNYYLQLIATVGILGTASFVLLAYKIVGLFIKSIRSTSDSGSHLPVLAASATASLIVLALLFIPVSVSLLFQLVVLLIITITGFKISGSTLVHEANIELVASSESGQRSPILPWISTFLTLLLLVPSAFFFSKAYAAEIYFQKGLTFASKNNGKATYESLVTAISLNPYKDSYRVAASQTNLLLANSAASKKDLTAEERTLVTQLIQQSIKEAKNAVSLNPLKVTNLENLAGIYQNLLNFAQGADSWAIASYRQAISLDPGSPTLRISLGGIYYSAKNYDEALRLFQQAADLKPDYPNAYYNLSAAYKELKNYKGAYQAMQTVINLIDKSSADYSKAQKELEDLSKLVGETAKPENTVPQNSQLESSPKTLPTPKVNPPIKLPAELGPETTGIPIPTSAPTPTPNP
jgi:tetratricopeptide (TPR) repeat protein